MGELRRPAASMLAPATGAVAPIARDTGRARVQAGAAPASLKILHVLRAPLGGLFRHVLDLAQGQAARGHRVGLIVDSTTGGARANEVLAQIAPKMALNIARVPIARQLGFGDIGALQFVAQRVASVEPDVVHGHGARRRRTGTAGTAWRNNDPRLHAARRIPRLRSGNGGGRLLSGAGAASQPAHRSLLLKANTSPRCSATGSARRTA